MSYRTPTAIDATPTTDWFVYLEGQLIASGLDRDAARLLLIERCAAKYDIPLLTLVDTPLEAYAHNRRPDAFYLQITEDLVSDDTDSFCYHDPSMI